MKIVNHWLEADGAGEKIIKSPSPNARPPIDPDYLVIHYTATDTAKNAIDWFMDTSNNPDKIAAHIVLDYDGTITQLVPFNCRANHAGSSLWDSVSQFNYHAIGIEIVNPGFVEKLADGTFKRPVTAKTSKAYPASEAARIIPAAHKHRFWTGKENQHWFIYPPAQLEALYKLSKVLIDTYHLATALGHDDISAGRKPDPGPAFPWDEFRTKVQGGASDTGKIFVTNTAGVKFRSGPSTASAAIKTLPEAYEVGVIETNGSWKRVYLAQKASEVVDGTRCIKTIGWVHASLLNPKK
jgi:N-acetylmuramoyl-L-alanine amidase